MLECRTGNLTPSGMSAKKAEPGGCGGDQLGPPGQERRGRRLAWLEPRHCVKSGHQTSRERTAGQAVEGFEAKAGLMAFILSALGASERL